MCQGSVGPLHLTPEASQGPRDTQESLSQSEAAVEQDMFSQHAHTSVVALPTRPVRSMLMVLEVMFKCTTIAGANTVASTHKYFFKSCIFRTEPQSRCQFVLIRVLDANSRLTLLLCCLRRSDRKPLLK